MASADPIVLQAAPATAQPAVLNPRVALLSGQTASLPTRHTNASAAAKSKVIGRRRQRRHENANMSDVPAIDRRKYKDSPHNLPMPLFAQKASFPVPPPPEFQRKATMTAVQPPQSDPYTAACGRFSMSLRGCSRTMRRIAKSGTRANELLAIVERELVDWLDVRNNLVWLAPDGSEQEHKRVVDPTLVHSIPANKRIIQREQDEEDLEPAIVELARGPKELRWLITDNFERYLCHLISRLWDVVSFSKTDDQGRRITHILAPNISQPNPQALKGGLSHLATPPTTDWEVSSMSGSFLSETASEADSERLATWEEESIQEEELVLSRITSKDSLEADVEWSSDEELARSVESLDMREEITPRATRSRTVLVSSALSSRESSVDSAR